MSRRGEGAPRPLLPAMILVAAATLFQLVGCTNGGGDGEAVPCAEMSWCGTVEYAGKAQGSWKVTMWQAGSTIPLASDSIENGQSFMLTPNSGQMSAGGTIYITAANSDPEKASLMLATVLGDGTTPSSNLVVNEVTTVATAFTMAQFWEDQGPGKEPTLGTSAQTGTGDPSYDLAVGIPNAATMWRNIATLDGETSYVLHNGPNVEGRVLDGEEVKLEDYVLGVVNALANIVQAAAGDPALLSQWLGYAHAPSSSDASCTAGTPANNTLLALASMARFPQYCVSELDGIALEAPQKFTPSFEYDPDDPRQRGMGWMIALLFDGTVSPDGPTGLDDSLRMDGPANFGIDFAGTIWVANNYNYTPSEQDLACASDLVMRLAPDGTYFGDPLQNDNLYGVGYGLEINPADGTVWLANFGFLGGPGAGDRPTPTCPEDTAKESTVSVFQADGTYKDTYPQPVTEQFKKPQGISYGDGTMYVAGCYSDTVGAFDANGKTSTWTIAANSEGRPALDTPFDTAFHGGEGGSVLWVTGNQSAHPNGKPGAVYRVPIDGSGGPDDTSIRWFQEFVTMPMGVDTTSDGTAWVASSDIVTAPCKGVPPTLEASTGWITYISADGESVTTTPEDDGGVGTPWGVWTDSEDDVWIANFSSQRVSRICGRREGCPGGVGHGKFHVAQGYHFAGFDRLTATMADPSGNLWVANNWLFIGSPLAPNPGGKQVVALVGLANPQRGIGPAPQGN